MSATPFDGRNFRRRPSWVCQSTLASVPNSVKETCRQALHSRHPRGRSHSFTQEAVEALSGPFGGNRICAVIAAPTAREAKKQFHLARAGTQITEVRLDYLCDDRERASFLAWLRRSRIHRGKSWIATCRSRRCGGLFAGGVKQQIEWLAQAVAAGCAWCDIEVEMAARISAEELRRALAPARLIISRHNFRGTPRNLASIIRQLGRAGGDAIKIAAHCNSVGESLRVLDVARERRNIIAVPMGEAGLPARVLALRSGSAMAYAAVDRATAPGQLPLTDMRDLYRADRLNRATRVYGVIGDPIRQSLGPVLHNSAFHEHGMNAVFLPFLVRKLGDFFSAISPLGVRGISVTRPHKERILRHLDGCDPLAARIGAVNTVVVHSDGRLYGYNTDYVGVLRSLERRMRLSGSRVLLLGAGGAARAAAFALAQAGAMVCICARRPARARALARAAGGEAISHARLRRESFDAIVNCTPVGMDSCPGVPVPMNELNCRLLMDMIYRPSDTEMLRRARRRNIETISGLEMFLAQGFAQYEIWTGERAPEPAMRRAVVAALGRAEGANHSR